MHTSTLTLLTLALTAAAAPQAPGGFGGLPQSGGVPKSGGSPKGGAGGFDIMGMLSGLRGGAPGAQPGGQINSPEAMKSPGTGKYPATYYAIDSLPQHTIYAPKTITPGLKIPVLVWGNGGCLNVGTIMAPFLIQLASQGVLVIANGPPADPNAAGTFASFGAAGQAKPTAMGDSLTWVAANAGKGNWTHVDGTRIAAAGQSCGGGDVYRVATDPRVSVLGIFNSGTMGGLVQGKVEGFAKPIFYFLGGPSDIAYKNGKGDYAKLAPEVVSWLGNWAKTGHGGTYNEMNGGEYGVAASRWVNWVLRGDTSQAAWFTSGGAEKDGWTEVTHRNMDKFKAPAKI